MRAVIGRERQSCMISGRWVLKLGEGVEDIPVWTAAARRLNRIKLKM